MSPTVHAGRGKDRRGRGRLNNENPAFVHTAPSQEFCLSLLHGEVFLIFPSRRETLPVLDLDSRTDC